MGLIFFSPFASRVLLLTSVVCSTLIPEHVVYCRKTFYYLFPGATQTLKHFTIEIY